MGQANLMGARTDEGSGHGRQKWTAGKTQPAEQATAGGHSQRILRPAQASKQTATDGRPRSETTAADDVDRSLAVQVSGGSAVVLALRKAGSDLPILSLPHLSPLPVTVPTHSLNLKNPI